MSSGRTRTEAEYRANGLRRLSVRIPAEALARLDDICEESGYSRGEQIQAMIDGDYEEWRKLVPRKK
jgi:metal-responsive CopG/Arc/MetJ family transcriptional regulator